MVLGVGKQVVNEVVLGELKWWSVKGRMEAMRLEYQVRMKAERGTKRAYQEGRRRVEEGGDREERVVCLNERSP